MRRADRRAFTLVELLVALVVSGVLVLGVHAALEQLGADERRVLAAAAAADREANGQRLLRALFLHLEVGTEQAGHFGGDERAVRFTTWCDVPAGWQERCEVEIAMAVDSVDGRAAIVARLAMGGTIVLRRGLDRAELRYLESAADGGHWFRRWGEGITAPVAVGIVADSAAHGDTTILRIGGRG